MHGCPIPQIHTLAIVEMQNENNVLETIPTRVCPVGAGETTEYALLLREGNVRELSGPNTRTQVIRKSKERQKFSFTT